MLPWSGQCSWVALRPGRLVPFAEEALASGPWLPRRHDQASGIGGRDLAIDADLAGREAGPQVQQVPEQADYLCAEKVAAGNVALLRGKSDHDDADRE